MQISNNHPMVSIGIPTYNRSKLLKRAIQSAINQDYGYIEVIVSDNASTDETHEICKKFGALIKYIRQPINLGPTKNFTEVLKLASGEYFMWLGDDDWIDASYVRTCVNQLIADPALSLVSGVPLYYKDNLVDRGKKFNILNNFWVLRVVAYYANVADNGVFYGVMRTSQIGKIKFLNIIGGDWLIVASLLSMGKMKIMPETHIHRDSGGTSINCLQIARTLGLSRIQGLLPMTSIAFSAWFDIVIRGNSYRTKSVFTRLMLAQIASIIIVLKTFVYYLIRVVNFFAKRLLIKKLFLSNIF